jgi:hypothetical protein
MGVPHSPAPAPSSAKIHQIAPRPVPGPSLRSASMARPLITSPAGSGQRSENRPTSRPDQAAASAYATPMAQTARPAATGEWPCTSWKNALK